MIRKLRLAFTHLQAGRYPEAERQYLDVLKVKPDHALSLHHLGLIAFKRGNTNEAISCLRRSLAADPSDSKAWLNFAILLGQAHQEVEAIAACRNACELAPSDADAFSVLGNLLSRSGDAEAAVAIFRRCLAIEPNRAAVRVRLGELLLSAGDMEAARAYSDSVQLHGENSHDAALLKLRILAAEGPGRCLEVASQLFVGEPGKQARIFDSVGTFLGSRGNHIEAVQAHQRAVELEPERSDWHFNLALSYELHGQFAQALESYRAGLALDPNRPEAYAHVGILLRGMEMYEGAVLVLKHALTLDPALSFAHYNLAVTLKTLGRFEESVEAFRMAIETAPDSIVNQIEYCNLRRMICEWADLEAAEEHALDRWRSSSTAIAPFVLISVPAATEGDQLEAGRRFAKSFPVPAGADKGPYRPSSEGGRIRIGYVSNDYCEHATALLLSELIELHDRRKFEVFGYCFSPDDGSAMRRRICAAFDHFRVIRDDAHDVAAERIREDGIEILIDLKGYTRGCRPEIFAHRPAPVQVNFLGYPGTMGADFIDYIVADPIALPSESAAHFSECVVHLPHSYQPNDRRRPDVAKAGQRGGHGLPENGFVFCSFNNSFKLNSDVFDVWMRLLSKVPGSVLWLYAPGELARENLKREAQRRGVDPGRIVFAGKIENSAHLGRLKHADLVLDSVPCGAHTTASDALWAGVPVLTVRGGTFAGRVAASLLTAVGLPELITNSLAEYEAAALTLARESERLGMLRQRLEDSRRTSPLFDSERFTRNLERAFETMSEIRAAGGRARPFTVVEDAARSIGTETDCRVLEQPRTLFTSCPICNCEDIPYQIEARITNHPLYKPQLPPTMKWRGCTSCEHVFAEGYFTKEALDLIFSSTNEGQKLGHDAEGQRKVSARMVERVAHYVDRGEWLDIGVGNGSLLFTAAEWGFRAVGTDLRRENVEMLRSLGLEAYCCDIEEIPGTARFDVVSLADVLEHVPFPGKALQEVHRLMKPGGALFVSMPNTDTIVWRALNASGTNPYWGEIEHYHNFDRRRLVELLARNGFRFASYNISERYRSCMEVIALRI